MKALVYEGVRTLEVRDVEIPVPEKEEHLVRVLAVGICGSDMHAYLGHDERRPAPLILGHEAAGVVESGPWKGRRVTINPLVTCATCRYCTSGRENLCPDRQIISMPPREGAFAQFISIPGHNLIEVPDGFSLEKAALCEPLAVSWHSAVLAMESIHQDMDRRAIVIGGGAIGLAAALALSAMGVDDVEIIEPNALRRQFLKERCKMNVSDAPSGTAPIVIDAVGFSVTRAAATKWVEPGGVIVHVGLGDSTEGLDIRRMTLQEITFIGSYTYTSKSFADTALALFEGRLGSLHWFETRSLSDGAKAFEDIYAGRVAAPKVVLDPWQ